MAGEDKAAKYTAGMSTAAAVMAALAWMKKPASAANGTIPDELMNLIISIAESLDHVDDNTLELINIIAQASFRGWPPNTDSIQTTRVICQIANQAYRLPSFPIPDGFTLCLAAYPLNTNLILFSDSASGATNPNSADVLAAGAVRTLAVQNADSIYVSALFPTDSVTLCSEMRR